MLTEQIKSTGSTVRPFTNGDPLTRLLKGKLNTNVWLATIVIVLSLNVPVVLLVAANNALFSQGAQFGLLQDYAWWIYQFLSVPATVLFFLWMPEGIQSVIDGLRKNKTILIPSGLGDNAFQEFIMRFDRSYSHPGWLIASIAFLTIYMSVALIPLFSKFRGWQTSGILIFWYHVAFWYLIFLLGALIVARVMVSIFWFNRLFKEFRVNVSVLHPDGAGGLSPLGTFSVKVGYIIGIFGIAAIAAIWSNSTYAFDQPTVLWNNPALIFLLITYVILAPIVFFAPIGSAHAAMKSAKEEFLMTIANQFEADFAKLQAVLGKDADELKAGLDKIEQLQKVHHIASSFPVWPFNIANLIRFFSATFSPILLALISRLISLLFP